jgi:GT2 family glycosyltransferase
VDGFFMACRGEMLREVGGWKGFKHNFHMYDVYLCLKAIRAGWKVMMVGCDVDHHGGGSSTKAEYWENCRERGTTPERDHWEPHLDIYNDFRDLLPLRIGA